MIDREVHYIEVTATDERLGPVLYEQGRVSQVWFAKSVLWQGIEGQGDSKDEALEALRVKVVMEILNRTDGIMKRYMNDEPLDGDDG